MRFSFTFTTTIALVSAASTLAYGGSPGASCTNVGAKCDGTNGNPCKHRATPTTASWLSHLRCIVQRLLAIARPMVSAETTAQPVQWLATVR